MTVRRWQRSWLNRHLFLSMWVVTCVVFFVLVLISRGPDG